MLFGDHRQEGRRGSDDRQRQDERYDDRQQVGGEADGGMNGSLSVHGAGWGEGVNGGLSWVDAREGPRGTAKNLLTWWRRSHRIP
ncbi:hypothetical protein GCM10009570_23310 [Dietzia natronolimnaea]